MIWSELGHLPLGKIPTSVLSIQDAVQGQTVENLILGVGLLIDNVTQAQNVDNVVLQLPSFGEEQHGGASYFRIPFRWEIEEDDDEEILLVASLFK